MRPKSSGVRPVFSLLSLLSLLSFISNPYDAGAAVYVHQSPVTLCWEAASGSVDHYNVYLSTNQQPFVLHSQAASTSFSLPVQDATHYVVQVEAEDATGITGPLSDPSEDVVVYLSGSAEDTDGDGMPDVWEVTYGLSPYDPADAVGDPDSDGLSNSAEFLAGMVPTDPDTDNDGILDGPDVQGGDDPPPPPPDEEDCPVMPADEDVFPVPEPGAYGRISGGDLTHTYQVSYSLPPGPGYITFSYEAWDVDYVDEVEILVNGNSVGFAPKTANNAWGPSQIVLLPDSFVSDSCPNLLTFRNTRNPPKTYTWGVRSVQLSGPPNPLPTTGAFGWGKTFDGDRTYLQDFVCSFPGTPEDVGILYEVWDVDFSDEVEISVNGNSVDFAPVTENESWGPSQTLIIPDSYVNDSSTNILTFRNTRNPTRSFWWGVRNISLP